MGIYERFRNDALSCDHNTRAVWDISNISMKAEHPGGKAACANRQKQTFAFKIQIHPMGSAASYSISWFNLGCCFKWLGLKWVDCIFTPLNYSLSWPQMTERKRLLALWRHRASQNPKLQPEEKIFFLWTGTTVLLISSAFMYNSYPRAIPGAAGSLSEIYMCMAPSGAITQLQRNSCLWMWRGSMKEGWAGRLEQCKAHVVPEKCCSKLRLSVS